MPKLPKFPKIIRGLSHTPAISNNVYQVGIQTKAISYKAYPAGKWLQGHTIIYPNGNAAQIMCKGFNAGQPVNLNPCAEIILPHELAANFPPPRRREAIEHTRRKLGLS